MRLCKASQKLLVDHWLKLQIVETNRRLWNCMNHQACEREQKRAIMSMLDGTEPRMKDTFVPSPGSIRPPEYPQGVAVPAGVGGPIPVPVPTPAPVPVPVGGRVGGRGPAVVLSFQAVSFLYRVGGSNDRNDRNNRSGTATTGSQTNRPPTKQETS